MSDLKFGVYRHYKNGKNYRVTGFALNTDTEEKMVVYQALYDCPDLEAKYGINPTFTRSYSVFTETVEYEGQTLPRYAYVGE